MNRWWITLMNHTDESHWWIKLIDHTDESHWWITLMNRTDQLHWGITLMNRTDESHWWITLMTHTSGMWRRGQLAERFLYCCWQGEILEMLQIAVGRRRRGKGQCGRMEGRKHNIKGYADVYESFFSVDTHFLKRLINSVKGLLVWYTQTFCQGYVAIYHTYALVWVFLLEVLDWSTFL